MPPDRLPLDQWQPELQQLSLSGGLRDGSASRIQERESGGPHNITLTYGTTKGGKHAYDYLTGWNFSENWVTDADRCEGIDSCMDAPDRFGNIPADPNIAANTPPGGNVPNGRNGSSQGDDFFTIRGATITGVSVPFLVSGVYGNGDSETIVTVSFVVDAAPGGDTTKAPMCEVPNSPQKPINCGVALWFAGHVADHNQWKEPGAGSIPGSPYHISIDKVDEEAIGQRDNQMQSSAVVTPGTIELKKVWIGDAGDVDLNIGTTSGGTEVITTPLSGQNGTTGEQLVPPGDYYVSEDVTNASNYTSDLSCTFNGQDMGTVSQPISIDEGDVVVCTYTNTRKVGSLQVTKSVNWSGTAEQDGQTFVICISGGAGSSFPAPAEDCKDFVFHTDPPGGSTLVQTWNNLIPGTYTVTEKSASPVAKSSWSVSGEGNVSVSETGQATKTITNTRKVGSLQVTKSVNWSGTAEQDGQTFVICISGGAGSSFPAPAEDCKDFVFHTDPPGGSTLVQTWNNLIPGTYTVTEKSASPVAKSSWSVSGEGNVSVSETGQATKTITNTRKVGSLQVTKSVNWSGTAEQDGQTFVICISGGAGSSFPAPAEDCKDFVFHTDPPGGSTLVQTWNNLIPGTYTVTEKSASPVAKSSWSVSGEGNVSVSETGQATKTITNTRKVGSLQVTKSVNWSGTAEQDGQTFVICISGGAGSSFPAPAEDCKDFVFHTDPPGGSTLVQTWNNLIPGTYTVTEKSASPVAKSVVGVRRGQRVGVRDGSGDQDDHEYPQGGVVAGDEVGQLERDGRAGWADVRDLHLWWCGVVVPGAGGGLQGLRVPYRSAWRVDAGADVEQPDPGHVHGDGEERVAGGEVELVGVRRGQRVGVRDGSGDQDDHEYPQGGVVAGDEVGQLERDG